MKKIIITAVLCFSFLTLSGCTSLVEPPITEAVEKELPYPVKVTAGWWRRREASGFRTRRCC